MYQNGKLIGEKYTEKMKATFTVDYTAGSLLAEGIDGNNVTESVLLETAGEVADIRLTADRDIISADGQELSFIAIECVDCHGRIVPVADNQLTISIDGPVSLIGLGNADIKDEAPYFDNMHNAWKGRALAVVRNNGKTGIATVSVHSKIADGRKIIKEIKINNCK